MRTIFFSRVEFIYIFAIFILSGLTFRALYMMHGDWKDLVDAAYGVTEGRPHWRAFQNRLLGPYLVLTIDWVLPTYKQSLLAFTAAGLLVQNFVFYLLLRLQGIPRPPALFAACMWSYIFIVLQDYWLYTWDIVDIIVFTLVSYVILFSKEKEWLLLIYLIAILNREIALLIPIFYVIVVLSGVLFGNEKERKKFKNYILLKIPSSIILMIVGIFYTKFSRDFLFIERPFGGMDNINLVIGNHIHILSNIKILFFHNFVSPSIFHTLMVLLSILYLIFIMSKTKNFYINCSIVLYLVIILNIIIFGIINETRMYLPLISIFFLIFFARMMEMGGIGQTGVVTRS
ncbi:hypothetical protein LGR54_00690 [Ancylobacter sp. Lp-2]|uniref:hypothetical protein n=1 Tax=Ancylobacter sp. Lp-2 TaxID=2881339 RepID=UPI001E2E98EF|nr:hypothetical protein [Ancylobacter sp. Lp-2]MCB4767109.1 hypothetical protein [Ancylobacter sp. Lp-2]